jgi:hypothetical protein
MTAAGWETSVVGLRWQTVKSPEWIDLSARYEIATTKSGGSDAIDSQRARRTALAPFAERR